MLFSRGRIPCGLCRRDEGLFEKRTCPSGLPCALSTEQFTLSNHYHLIAKITDAKRIPKFIGEVNGASSRAINQADLVIRRKIWWNYYDHIIRNEADFFKHLNYIHQNPVKHGATKELSYPFSSYDAWVTKKGREYLEDAFTKYPVVDFTIANDEF